MFSIFLFSIASEWIENNIFQIISLLVIVIGGIISFTKLQSEVAQISSRVKDIEDSVERFLHDFNNHTKDKDAHVNHLYMSSLKEQLNKVETAVEKSNQRNEASNQKILEKLDSFIQQIYKK